MGDVRLLVALRWAAIAFQLSALWGAVVFGLPVHVGILVGSLVIQVLVNGVTAWGIARGPQPSEWYVFSQLLFDFAVLIVFVVNSGGMANPFSGLFLIQALLAALLVSRLKMWIMFGLTGAGYTVLLLAFNESPHDHHRWMAFHMAGMVVNHVLTTAVIGWIVVKIVRNLRMRERQVSSRQGLVAAGAFSAQIAHKLGTPLNMIALIADDISPATCASDRSAILTEVDRSKMYLTNLFKRLVRIESDQDVGVMLHDALPRLLELVGQKHPGLQVEWTVINDHPVRGASLELISLLAEIFIENAAEAGAKTAWVHLSWDSDGLKMTVKNDGPPLSADFQELMTVGTSTKGGTPHFGIGLFLARLVIESLAGTVSVDGPPGVTFTIRIARDSLEGKA
jgi:two-component system sensor histidine kinase RegB